ncbi:hypothetical protein Q5P01_016209 [Channa striata]|uniref:trypsin n=1 Tax=Channa striata TaxID=64152 RepID=A0AA88MDH6_CHASR|nr:hypothetical protein Q5P01_016209 [Channa striata]
MFIHLKLTLLLALTLDARGYTRGRNGNHEAVPHSRPYMVLLERHMEDKTTNYCGGFLLNEDFVMTAAHCQAKFFTALLGVHHVFSNNVTQRISVEQAIPHINFNRTDLSNDIMLLKLTSDAHFNKNVSPITLGEEGDGSLPRSCIVSGWGKSNKNTKYMSSVLMEGNVTLIDNERCNGEKVYCSMGGTRPAEGDSGIPLVCEGKAYGVASSSLRDKVAQLDRDLIMSAQCKLVTLMFALALHGQVYTLKIIGGHEAVPHSRPYMVLLERHMDDKTTNFCGGFLLNEDFVMTAAHCQAKSYTVLLGIHNVHTKSQTLSVKHDFPHKGYNATDYRNDIMLLKLNSKAKFNKNVSAIALAEGDGSLPSSCIVSGWGISKKNEDYMSVDLMEVNVTLVDEEQCPKANSYCSKGEAGPAEGDSGGPLVCKDGKAYGVVCASLKSKNDDARITAYTKITDYGEWINSIIQKYQE